ncbi:DNA excision repair protein ERCC-1 [Spatholobus suberectus]|nr:DNA excision repair protein ERCC-1 [Spatholobus suberectus]
MIFYEAHGENRLHRLSSFPPKPFPKLSRSSNPPSSTLALLHPQGNWSVGRSIFTSTSSTAAAAAASSTLPSSQLTQSRNSILVSHRQKGNALLKHIRNVRWAFADVVCDYLLGQSSCALYLSLRYHLLHPDYLYYRIRESQKHFKLRVVLICNKPLLEVTKTALLHDCTLLCGWSLEECGRYLETIKVYENKPADIIQGQMDTDYLSRSLSNVMGASMEDLARCPGIGERKVKRLFDTFHEPFKRVESSWQAIPETSVRNMPASPVSSIKNNAESSSLIEDKQEDVEDVSKRRKKEPEVTVKSALSAAFAKYSDRVGRGKALHKWMKKENQLF